MMLQLTLTKGMRSVSDVDIKQKHVFMLNDEKLSWVRCRHQRPTGPTGDTTQILKTLTELRDVSKSEGLGTKIPNIYTYHALPAQ